WTKNRSACDQSLLHEYAQPIRPVLAERGALGVAAAAVQRARRRLVNPGLEAHQRKAFARRLVLDATKNGAPDVLAARLRDDEHALYFPVPHFDAQRAAADRIDAATRYKKTDVRRAKRLHVEEMVAFRRIERLQRLAALRKSETDPRVRRDLDLLIDAVERQRRTRALEHRLLIPYFDLPKHVFEGLQMLLDARNGESRHRNALQRMRIYAGLEHGVAPFAELARARASERFAIAGLLWPYEAEIGQHLENCERYIAGIAELFRASEVRDWQSAHERLAAQLRAHCEWVRDVGLPRARKDHTLPRELYAERLKSFGLDITPEQAISTGMLAFADVREEISRLATQLARERKLDSGDYRQVLRELKRQQV